MSDRTGRKEILMNLKMPGGLNSIGGIFPAVCGIVSLVIALTFGVVFYEVDPNGVFGHVGIMAGIAVTVCGMKIIDEIHLN